MESLTRMCIPNTALNNFSKLTETSVQRSPNDGIVNGPLQKGSLTILLSMSIFLVRKRKSLTAVFLSICPYPLQSSGR